MLINNEELFENLKLDNYKIQKKQPFDKNTLQFLYSLSSAILKNKQSKKYPDLITFGFFCRKSNLIKNKIRYEKELEVRIGLGLSVHIAPSNIPINFAFSFVFGLLSGNANAIRLPSKPYPQNLLLLEIINNLLNKEDFKDIKDSTIFFNSHRDSLKLKELCRKADALIVWGGDSTVQTFKNYVKKINCIELLFPNRLSSLIINSKVFVEEKNKRNILEKFYNDTYLVDQNACSSPTNIFWYGDKHINKKAQILFWDELKKVLKNKNYHLPTISQFDKYINVLRALNETSNKLNIEIHDANIWEGLNAHNSSKYFNLGLFSSLNIINLNQMTNQIRDNEQTITYFGLDPKKINDAIKLGQVTVDRIVPIGSALDIGLIWDGKDVIRYLSTYTEVL